MAMEFINDINIDNLVSDLEMDMKELDDLMFNLDDFDDKNLRELSENREVRIETSEPFGAFTSIDGNFQTPIKAESEIKVESSESFGALTSIDDDIQNAIKDEGEIKVQSSVPFGALTSIDDEIINAIKGEKEIKVDTSSEDFESNCTPNPENVGKWIVDTTVPEGWKVRRSRLNLTRLKNPSGKVFNNRLAAVQELVLKRHPYNEVEEMKNLLRYDGWCLEEYLPPRWMYKFASNHTYQFLTENFKVVESTSKAFEHLELENYGSVHVDNFLKAMKNIAQIKSKKLKIKREETSPSFKILNQSENLQPANFISPSGFEFSSCVEAYLHLVKTGESEESNAVKKSMKSEGWNSCSMLPDGWISDGCSFISQEGFYFETESRVLEFLGNFDVNSLSPFEAIKIGSFLQSKTSHIPREARDMNIQIEQLTQFVGNNQEIKTKFPEKDIDFMPHGYWKICESTGQRQRTLLIFSDGNRFQSRRSALKFMIHNNYPEDYIITMKSEMEVYGWKSVYGLPPGWMMRAKNEGPGWKKRDFINYTGEYFQTAALAFKYMIKSGSFKNEELNFIRSFSYTQQNNIDQMKQSGQGLNQGLVSTNYRDSLQPISWKCEPGTKSPVVFTDGKRFPSKRLALKFMIANSFHENDITRMKHNLEIDGYKEVPGLPAGWLMRKQNGKWKMRDFIDDLGNHFPTPKFAANSMIQAGTYSETELSFMRAFSLKRPAENVKRNDVPILEENYIENNWKQEVSIDISMNGNKPSDSLETDHSFWKSEKIGNGKTMIYFPNGQKFESRIQALKYLVANQYEEVRIEKIRAEMEVDGWKYCESLPPGWRIRIQTDVRGWRSQSFMDDLGNTFPSAKRAGIYMHQSGRYSQDEIFIMETIFSKELTGNHIKSQEPAVKKEPSTFSTNQETHSTFSEGFTSRRFKLKKLIDQNYPAEEIEKLRDELSLEGWLDHPKLPAGWKTKSKDQEKGWKKRIFLSQCGLLFKSAKKAILFMKNSGTFSQDEINSVCSFSTQGINLSTQFHDNFLSRRAKLQFLVKNNYTEEEINQARNELQFDGWMDDPNLPKGWKTKRRTNKTVFLSDCGNSFREATSAVRFMESSGKYSKEEIGQVASFYATKRSKTGFQREEMQEAGNVEYEDAFKEVKKFDRAVNYYNTSSGVKEDFHRNSVNYHNVSREAADVKEEFKEEVEEFDQLLNKVCDEDSSIQDNESRDDYEELEECKERPNIDIIDEFKEEVKEFDKLLNKVVDNDYPDKLTEPKLEDLETQEYNHLVPAGWNTIKCRDGKIYYISPNGRKFPSRRSALCFMISKRFPPEYSESLRPFLYLEGWADNELLPWKWKTAIVKNGPKFTKRIFMSENGDRIETLANAIKYMEDSGNHSGLELDNILKINDLKVKEEENESLIKEEEGQDHNLPKGWKSYIDRKGRRRYLGPNPGDNVLSLASAYRRMKDRGSSVSELEEMRTLLKHNGWEDHHKLPKNWKTKMTKNGNKNGNWKKRVFLNEDGIQFGDLKSAVTYLEKSGKYSKDDLQNLLELETPLQIKVEEGINPDNENSKKSIPTPKGWKSYLSKDGRWRFLSPDGNNFASLTAGYRHMIDKGFPVKDLTEMRHFLKFEKWEESSCLPPLWMVKFTKNGSRGRWKRRIFLSQEGRMLETGNAIAYMQKSGRFTPEEIYKIQSVSSSLPCLSLSLGESDATYVADESLPEGWKIKFGIRGKNYFLSPEGKGFVSRRVALVHMIAEKHPELDIEIMRKSLTMEGWLEHHNLPEGWKFKNVRNDQNCISVVTDSGQHISTIVKVMEVLKSEDNRGCIEKFNMFLKEIKDIGIKKIREEIQKVDLTSLNLEDWRVNVDSLPSGWMTRTVSDVKSYFLSPDFIQFPIDDNTLKYLATNGALTKESTDLASQLLKYNGWSENKFLPLGWKTKRTSIKEIKFLSESGELMDSLEKAIFYFTQNEVSKESLMNFEEFILNSESCSFKDDKTVPLGWKLGQGRKMSIILAPNKKRYKSRVQAMKDLVKCKASEQTIWNMRNYLQFEGWVENENLPTGWMYRAMDSGDLIFLSPKAEQFDSMDDINEEISKDEYYSGHNNDNFNLIGESRESLDEPIEDKYQMVDSVEYLEEKELDELISLEEDLLNTLEEDIGNTMDEDLGDTLDEDIGETLEEDIRDTLEEDICDTLEEDFCDTLEEDICDTLEEDVGDTLEEDIGDTLEEDIGDTLEEDIGDTLEEDMSNTREDDLSEPLLEDLGDSLEDSMDYELF